jgi:hypothetical protein
MDHHDRNVGMPTQLVNRRAYMLLVVMLYLAHKIQDWLSGSIGRVYTTGLSRHRHSAPVTGASIVQTLLVALGPSPATDDSAD